MEFTQIKELICLFDKSSLSRLLIKTGGAELRMDKMANTSSSAAAKTAPLSASPQEQADATPETIVLPAAVSEPITIIPIEKTDLAPGNIVRSPLVGTFYQSAQTGGKPFVSVGSKVSAGDVLCIVEAMKVMNEITSKYAGEVAEIFMKDGQMAEYNQPLFRII